MMTLPIRTRFALYSFWGSLFVQGSPCTPGSPETNDDTAYSYKVRLKRMMTHYVRGYKSLGGALIIGTTE